jgi:hypothetical protein
VTITATYSGSLVLTIRPDWQGPSQQFTTTYDKTRLDNAVGTFTDDAITPTAVGARGVRFILEGRDVIAAWRAFCDGQRGRAVGFWMPTWTDDVELTAAQLAAQDVLTFKTCGFSRFYAVTDFGRRHIAIILPGNPEVILPRRVTAAVDNGDGTETITVDSLFGVDIPIDAGVSFLTFCRFDNDRIDLDWLSFVLVQVEFGVVELPREAPTS